MVLEPALKDRQVGTYEIVSQTEHQGQGITEVIGRGSMEILVCQSDRGLGWSGRGTQKMRFDPDCGDFEVLC